MTFSPYMLLRRWFYALLRRAAPLLLPELEKVGKARLRKRAADLLAAFQSCGRHVRVPGRLNVSDPRSVAVGHGVTIGDNACFNSEGGLTIGDRVRIGRDVLIETFEHEPGRLHRVVPRAVAIGPDVCIGPRAVILPGSRIGAGAVVPAGGVVAGEIAAHTTYNHPAPADAGERDDAKAGVPARPPTSSGVGAEGLVRADAAHARLFFVVSTGRSGSQAIARVLSQHPGITCLHEPRPQMIRLSTELAHGDRPGAAVEQELRAIFCESSVFPSDRLYGESDQKYWNLIPLLADLLPESRFIWLIRDGRDVVASTLSRNWFPTRENAGSSISHDLRQRWLYYRLHGARCGCFTDNEWNALSLFEKHCWHWAYLNSTIEKNLSLIPVERRRMVHLESLNSSTEDLLRFLGVDAQPVKVETHNRSLHKIDPHSNWSAEQRGFFERWCGVLMDQWYAGWRD